MLSFFSFFFNNYQEICFETWMSLVCVRGCV